MTYKPEFLPSLCMPPKLLNPYQDYLLLVLDLAYSHLKQNEFVEIDMKQKNVSYTEVVVFIWRN